MPLTADPHNRNQTNTALYNTSLVDWSWAPTVIPVACPQIKPSPSLKYSVLFYKLNTRNTLHSMETNTSIDLRKLHNRLHSYKL